MAEEQLKVTPELEKSIGEAQSTDQISRLVKEAAAEQGLALPRDDQGRFVAKPTTEEPAQKAADTKEAADEDKQFTDTFTIGGKTVEISGADAADVLRQYKAAVAAYDIARQEAQPKQQTQEEPKKPLVTEEELIALSIRIQSGDLKALDEYMEKTGAVDRYLSKRGINVGELETTLKERVETKTQNAWEKATNDFKQELGAEWPGGNQNMKLMGYKLAELGLTENPSKDSLLKAFNALKEDGMIFQAGDDDQATATNTSTTNQGAAPTSNETQKTDTTPKRKATGSSVFGVSGGSTTKQKTVKATNVPSEQELKNMDPREIMRLYREGVAAQGGDPNLELAKTYSR